MYALSFWLKRWQRHLQDGSAYSVDRSLSPNARQAERLRLQTEIQLIVPRARGAKVVLDYGCGEGRFHDLWKSLGYIYIGADVIDEMLRRNSARYPSVFVNVDKVDGSVQYDYVFLSLVIQHLEDDEAIAVLRKIRSPNVLVIDNSRKDGPDYVRYRKALEIQALAEAAGWEDHYLQTFRTGHADYKIYSGKGRADSETLP